MCKKMNQKCCYEKFTTDDDVRHARNLQDVGRETARVTELTQNTLVSVSQASAASDQLEALSRWPGGRRSLYRLHANTINQHSKS